MNKEQILTKIWEAITPYINKPKQPVFEIVKDIIYALPDPMNNTDKIVEVLNSHRVKTSVIKNTELAISVSNLAQEINALSEGEVNYNIPTSWLDSLLTGDKAVIGSPPYGCDDIENLLNELRKRTKQTDTEIAKRAYEKYIGEYALEESIDPEYLDWLDKAE